MARPRKYVITNGHEVTGVSRHHDGRYYVLIGGKRVYFKELEQARVGYRSSNLPPWTEQWGARAVAVERWKALKARYEKQGLPMPRMVAELDAIADEAGIPPMAIRDVTPAGAETPSPKGPTLTEVIEQWREMKVIELGSETQHVRDTVRLFRRFAAGTGVKKLAELTPKQFREFHVAVSRQGAKRSPKWFMDQVKGVKHVLAYCRKKYPEWPWPNGLLEWAGAYTARTIAPKASNREPIPIDVFARLLAEARAWGSIEPAVMAKATQKERAARLHAQRKRREGQQLTTILLLALNCGLDNVDVARVTWANIKLDAALPYLDLPRSKVARRVGQSVTRWTPLLPDVVAQLRTWRTMAPPGDLVFRTARGAAYAADRLSNAMAQLKKAAGVTGASSFKHLRNVGPTLAKRAKLSPDERNAFLGHTVNGTSRFYEGDVDESYLLPLVELIGTQYLDGQRGQADQCDPT